MRKYLLALTVGSLLAAGQAAATDSGLVSLGDRVGSPSATANDDRDRGGAWLLFAAAIGLIIAVIAVGEPNSGQPASP